MLLTIFHDIIDESIDENIPEFGVNGGDTFRSVLFSHW